MTIIFCLILLAAGSWVIASLWLNESLNFKVKRSNSADQLNLWLQKWQLMSTTGGSLSELGEIPEFKFFSRLAEAGLRHARTFGSFPRDLLWEWRDGLAKERAFEKRWRAVNQSAYAQFLIFILITWSFVFITSGSIEIQLPFTIYLGMIVLQIMGLVFFPWALSSSARMRLKGFSELLESLYVLRSLSGAGIATAQVLSEAKLENLVQTKITKILVERVLKMAQIFQKQGGALGREAQILLQETWFLREESLTQLVKWGEAIKLVFLLVFFAGAYFLFLLGLVFELLKSN
ncbi:MAG: hypothetical protein K2P81_00010 [Bacteriovoracaceae bacterium]|nr:hypothetical protein [Bacteriovoracaceae bacterium]